MWISTLDPAKGEVKVGEYNPVTQIFTKKVKRSKHFFRLIQGYALQADVLSKLDIANCQSIEIHEEDTGKTLTSTLDVWKKMGRPWTGKNGKQIALSEKYMN